MLVDVLQGDFFLARQGVIQGGDQYRFVGKQRRVPEVIGHLQHGAHGEVHVPGPQQFQPVYPRDIMQFYPYFRVKFGKAINDFRQ